MEPVGELNESLPLECIAELRAKDRTTLLVVERTGVSKVVDVTRYGDLDKTLRVTKLVVEFVRCLQGKLMPDMESVECLWIQEVQKELLGNKEFHRWEVQLNLFQDNYSIWRCKGRLENTQLPLESKFPILLTREHWYTRLVIRKAHKRVLHNGVRETLTEVRSKFWIIRGKSLVKQVIAECTVCRRLQSKPLQAPPPALPSYRVQEAPPFAHTGIDYAGPIQVKINPRGCYQQKVWICLFTCCVTRAVHLDIVEDLLPKSFIKCLKRFAARRGVPRRIITDNGTTFVAASKTLKEIICHPEVQHYFSEIRVKWDFNIAWWGGIFERLIKSTKICLRKMIGQARLTREEFLTVLIEVEGVLNSRPLSYVSMADIDEPLTPSHLLTGGRLLDHLCYQEEEDYQISLIRRVECCLTKE